VRSAFRAPRRTLVAKPCAAAGLLRRLGCSPRVARTSLATVSPVVPMCTTSTTVVWLYIPAGSVAAGSSYYDLRFTNLSAHTCELGGYPACRR
jgi:hypothetical protein